MRDSTTGLRVCRFVPPHLGHYNRHWAEFYSRSPFFSFVRSFYNNPAPAVPNWCQLSSCYCCISVYIAWHVRVSCACDAAGASTSTTTKWCCDVSRAGREMESIVVPEQRSRLSPAAVPLAAWWGRVDPCHTGVSR